MNPSDGEVEKPRDTRALTSPGDSGEITAWEFATMVIWQRRVVFVVWSTLMALGVAAILVSTSGQQYTATASFYPQGGAGSSTAIAGLAAQYGFAVPASQNAESPQFYAEFLQSRTLLNTIVESRFRTASADGDDGLTLIEYFSPHKQDQRQAREAAVKELRRRLRVEVDRQTGVVAFSVTAPEPTLASLIAERIIAAVNEYNVSNRQSNAAAERRFVESRLEHARTELDEAEKALEDFLRQNRQFENSPELTFAFDRLQRGVALKQQAVISLSQALDQARIEEVRNVPVISVFEEPEVPLRPDPTGRVWLLLGLTAFSTLGAIATGLVAGLIARSKSGAADYEGFRRALADARKSPLRTPRPDL